MASGGIGVLIPILSRRVWCQWLIRCRGSGGWLFGYGAGVFVLAWLLPPGIHPVRLCARHANCCAILDWSARCTGLCDTARRVPSVFGPSRRMTATTGPRAVFCCEGSSGPECLPTRWPSPSGSDRVIRSTTRTMDRQPCNGPCKNV